MKEVVSALRGSEDGGLSGRRLEMVQEAWRRLAQHEGEEKGAEEEEGAVLLLPLSVVLQHYNLNALPKVTTSSKSSAAPPSPSRDGDSRACIPVCLPAWLAECGRLCV